MIKRPKKNFLKTAGDWAHKSIVFGCIGLTIYSFVGIGAWFYHFKTLTNEDQEKVILKTIEKLNQQENVDIVDKAKELRT